MFEEIAPQCLTSTGHLGEVTESLVKTTDATWVANMIRLVDEQIAHVVASATPQSSEIAF